MDLEQQVHPAVVAPGIYQVQVPLPFALSVINLYLIETSDGCILVDCGVDNAEAFEALLAALRDLGRTLADLRLIVITHVHVDHYGLAARLRQLSGAQVVMHALDSQRADDFFDRQGDSGNFVRRLGELNGMPEQIQEGVADIRRGMDSLSHKVEVDRRVDDGDIIQLGERRLRVIWTPGHSEGHMCLYDRAGGVLFSGDHVLPQITPHIGMGGGLRPNPLADYLSSLERIRELPVGLALPSHGPVFENVQERIDEIRRHHDRRLRLMLGKLQGEPKTAYEVACSVFGEKLSIHNAVFAFMETLAHLEFLRLTGAIARLDGVVYRYACAEDQPAAG